MVRSATTTTAAANSGRLEPPTNHNNVWKRGHVSRGSVGDKIQVIPGFKTSAGMYTHLVTIHQRWKTITTQKFRVHFVLYDNRFSDLMTQKLL